MGEISAIPFHVKTYLSYHVGVVNILKKIVNTYIKSFIISD